MTKTLYVPHINWLLQALGAGREDLLGKGRLAVPAPLLRKLLTTLAEALAFDEAFYLAQYPDLAGAHARGDIADLRRHFIEVGFLEGRLGHAPDVDEEFYTTIYPDVAQAIARGDVPTGMEHFLRTGMAEGRVPNAALVDAIDAWFTVLRDDVRA